MTKPLPIKDFIERGLGLAMLVAMLLAFVLNNCAPMPNAPQPACTTRCYHYGPACPPD